MSKNQIHSIVRLAQGNTMIAIERSDLSNELRQDLFATGDRSADPDDEIQERLGALDADRVDEPSSQVVQRPVRLAKSIRKALPLHHSRVATSQLKQLAQTKSSLAVSFRWRLSIIGSHSSEPLPVVNHDVELQQTTHFAQSQTVRYERHPLYRS